MAREQFPRKAVERSFRAFKDRVDDVTIATYGTWDNAFTHLMNHCERDPIMGVVVDPLRGRMVAEAVHWIENTQPSDVFMLPEDDEDRLAMLYQLMLAVYRDQTNLMNLAMTIEYGADSHYLVGTVNDQVIRPFTREVSYQIDDILESTRGDEQVSTEALLVFHYHDGSQTIHVGPGSIVATNGSSVSESRAAYTHKSELGAALDGLRAHIDGVAADQREAVTGSIALLIRALEDNTIPRDVIDVAAETTVAASPAMKRALRDVALGTAGSLVASAIQQAVGN